MRLLLASVALAIACSPPQATRAPDGGPGPGDDAAPRPDAGQPAPERSCDTVFRYAPAQAVGSVELAGEWDWSVREPMTPTDDGAFELAVPLEPGLYAYKLVVDGDWILDPGTPYRTYDGGIENSMVRVGDCTRALLELASFEVDGNAAAARVTFIRGNGGDLPDDATAVLRTDFTDTPAQASFDGRTIAVDLTGLAPGKHTLIVKAADAEPLWLPFWVEPEPFDWRDAVLYMIMVDRFRNGNPDNDPAPAPGATPTADYHGGDIAGITAAIEDGTFDALGIRALWLSPLSHNTGRVHAEHGQGVTAYHGYWPVRARAVDPRFGTPEELERLVAAAHARGIRVLLDYVINHVHEDHEYVDSYPDGFRTGCVCGTSGCGWTERRLDCLFHPYMPDVDWQDRYAAEQFVTDALWWLERFDLDGLRVDAVKHVEDAAIANLSARVHERFEQAGTEYFLLGETAMGWAGHSVEANQSEYDTISRYIGPFGLSGQFDFVLYHATAYRVFADDQYGMPHLDFWTRASLDNYPASAIMTPYIGSHDTERFITLATYGSDAAIAHHKWPHQGLPAAPTTDEPYQRMAAAMTWLLSVPGAPLVYYGDEYGEHGGADPDNRHMWVPPAARTDRQRALHARIAAAGAARRDLVALRRGGYRSLTATERFLAFARETSDQTAVVAINFSASPATHTIPVGAVTGPLRDALDPDRPPVAVQSGAIEITLPAWGTAILHDDL